MTDYFQGIVKEKEALGYVERLRQELERCGSCWTDGFVQALSPLVRLACGGTLPLAGLKEFKEAEAQLISAFGLMTSRRIDHFIVVSVSGLRGQIEDWLGPLAQPWSVGFRVYDALGSIIGRRVAGYGTGNELPWTVPGWEVLGSTAHLPTEILNPYQNLCRALDDILPRYSDKIRWRKQLCDAFGYEDDVFRLLTRSLRQAVFRLALAAVRGDVVFCEQTYRMLEMAASAPILHERIGRAGYRIVLVA